MAEVIKKIENNILKITLNRPEKMNAFNPKMIQQLTEIFSKAAKNTELRAIYLKGAGASFCAGADLEWMKSMAKFDLKENLSDAGELYEMFAAIKNCPLPVVGRIQGNVYGGGLGLVSVCDIAVAEASSQYCFSEVKLGLVPAVISSFVLDKMHSNKARELMMTGRLFDANVAQASGLVEFVGRELEINKYLDETFQLLSKAGPEAIRLIKGFLSEVQTVGVGKAKKISVEMIAKKRVSAEGQEGLQSFLQGRKPKWILPSTDNIKKKTKTK
jgi:methylglutaconyl-CoA hydratase